MILRPIAASLMLIATTANAAVLPLKPGTYVLADTPCKDPAFAAMFSYDGHAFSYPHATHCQSVILFHAGQTYSVRETCSALGDGTPAAPVTIVSTYTIESAIQVAVDKGNDHSVNDYRWCPS